MSLKGDKYENAEEVKFRLLDTVVLYEGCPVLISKVESTGLDEEDNIARVYFRTLPGPSDKMTRKYLKSRHFDISPFPMGYCKLPDGRVVYVTRTTSKQYKQGLAAGNMQCYSVDKKDRDYTDFSTVIYSAGFSEMVLGSYPDYRITLECVRSNEDLRTEVLHRKYAVKKDDVTDITELFFETKRCGYFIYDVATNSYTLTLGKNFKFLKEEIVETFPGLKVN